MCLWEKGGGQMKDGEEYELKIRKLTPLEP